jgi:hypothetical protein
MKRASGRLVKAIALAWLFTRARSLYRKASLVKLGFARRRISTHPSIEPEERLLSIAAELASTLA